ncbi:MAG TPA: mandelate racemase/muconate lactonizing enzyme family protein [Burkholderiaceae bacterium]|jgi:L-alanine-DL-glutamate epimerase-like enolase superfamily enzyme
MKIASIDVLRVAIPFDDGGVPAGASAAASAKPKAMETLLVKLTADSGEVGWGEAFGHRINASTFAALAECVGPLFIGAEVDPGASRVASTRLEEAHKAFHLFGRTGPALYAISALDIALWDLKAQALKTPLHRLLGGRRQRVTCYASLVTYNANVEAVVRNALRAHAAGFRHIKLHEKDFDAIRAVREALPSDVALMVDVNCVWPPAEARVQATRLASLGLTWLEEPVWPPDDVESLAALRDIGLPLAAGENASGLDGYERCLKAGAVDVIQPSVTKLGGITAMFQAFELGRRHGARVQPHCFYYGAGLMATAHAVAGLDEHAMLEVPWVEFEQHLSPASRFAAQFTLDDTPGLGFVPDAGVLEKYLIERARVG